MAGTCSAFGVRRTHCAARFPSRESSSTLAAVDSASIAAVSRVPASSTNAAAPASLAGPSWATRDFNAPLAAGRAMSTTSAASWRSSHQRCAASNSAASPAPASPSTHASTIGRSPEIACAHSAGAPPRPRASAAGSPRHAKSGCNRGAASVWYAVVAAESSAVRDAASTSSPSRASTDSSVLHNASRSSPASVSHVACNVAPGASVTRRRRQNTGSSTIPALPASATPSSNSRGSAIVRHRPSSSARSVSNPAASSVPPSMRHPCAARIGFSSPLRGRRQASNIRPPSMASVSTNIFENAGCAASAPSGPMTSSTADASSNRRGLVPAFESVR